jgi:fibronectin type 3 domain-containing protein
MRPLQYLILSLAAITLLTAGCSKDDNNPIAPVPVIPVPTNLGAVIGQDRITLSWSADTTFAYNGFAVHRSEDNGGKWTKVGTSPTSPYADSTVRTGVVYLYAVSGINSAGVEGKRSSSLAVMASFFSVLINNGAIYTNQRNVTLRFSAPQGTQLVRFSEDPALTGEPWFDYQTTFAMALSNGDGSKSVYAEFTDQEGFTTESVADTIILDTESLIQSTSFSPGPPVQLGATLHFVVTPVNNELDGSAEISIETFPTKITALDDGTAGDPIKNDGVYETDFTMPQSFRGVDLIVSAIFTDAAGNRSDVAEFSDRLSFTDPPAAVTLFPPEDSTTTSVSLRWSESNDPNFDRYEIYRDQSPSVDKTVSPRVATIPLSTTTIFTDNGLQEAETYYYLVYVVNDLEECTGSNIRMAQTEDIPPTPVVLDPPSSVGPDRLTLTWSMNNDTDFQEYKIFRDTSPGVTEASLEVATISDQFQTFFDDSGLDTVNNTYYYRVYVFDKGGNSARSNEVSSP